MNLLKVSSTLLLACLAASGATQPRKPTTPYPAMASVEQYRIADAKDEIALARSAAPVSISGDAEVLVLGKQGYETAVKGTNGFVCFVERSWAAKFEDIDFWNPKLRAPNCFNTPAVRSVLPQYLQRTKWVLSGGVGKPQLIERTKAALSGRPLPAPEAGSLSFMLSKQGYLGDQVGGPWQPHVMFFVPHGQAAAWGAGLHASPILGGDSSEFEFTVLYVPVARWSDGSPAAAASTEHRHDS
jgi:hypothetical protein